MQLSISGGSQLLAFKHAKSVMFDKFFNIAKQYDKAINAQMCVMAMQFNK